MQIWASDLHISETRSLASEICIYPRRLKKKNSLNGVSQILKKILCFIFVAHTKVCLSAYGMMYKETRWQSRVENSISLKP